MQDSGIVSNVDTGGLISEIGTSTPTVYGEYDDLDLLDYVEQNAFVGMYEVSSASLRAGCKNENQAVIKANLHECWLYQQ